MKVLTNLTILLLAVSGCTITQQEQRRETPSVSISGYNSGIIRAASKAGSWVVDSHFLSRYVKLASENEIDLSVIGKPSILNESEDPAQRTYLATDFQISQMFKWINIE